MVTHLVEFAVRETLSRGSAKMQRLATGHLHIKALVTALYERAEFVDGEIVLDPVAELFRDIAGVVGKSLRRILRPPAAVLLLKRLWQVPVIQRRERFDTRLEQFVDQTVVEVHALAVRLAGAVREDARPCN